MRDDCKAHIGVVLLYSGGKRVLYRIVIETRSDEYFIVYFVTIYVCVNRPKIKHFYRPVDFPSVVVFHRSWFHCMTAHIIYFFYY